MITSTSVSALVLRRADWRDYDRMVTLLTAEHGLVDAVARGCRRPKSELMNASEPFVCGLFQLYYKDEKCTIVQCKITEGFMELRLDYDKLVMGAGWLRLLEAVSQPEQPNPELFTLAVTALTYLSKSDIEIRLLDCMFKLQLCRLAGISPNVERCVGCGKTPVQTELGFDARRGGCVCPDCAANRRPLSEGARRILLKAPKAPYKSVPLLIDRPEWREAYERINEFLKVQNL